MNEFEKKVLTFYTMLANAYREPEDMEEAVDKLTLYIGYDFNDDIAAMLSAMMLFVDKIIPDITKDMDLIGFTHLLNRIAIQHCFDIHDGDDEEEA